MMPSLVDHIFFILIAIALPIYSYRSWQSFKKHLARKRPFALRNGYVETIAIQWSFAIFMIFWWIYTDKDFGDVGIALVLNFKTYISLAITLLGVVFLAAQLIQIKNLKEIPDSLKKQIEPIADLIPETVVERKLFVAVAITAGLVEELLYRGFLIWYLNSYLHWVIAALLSVLIFGFAHTYQGKSGLLKAIIVSIIFLGLYLWSGSLIGPMILHVVLDLTSGSIASHVKTREKERGELTAGVTNFYERNL
jgi:membrane protease YdiL (CAAX protease family)